MFDIPSFALHGSGELTLDGINIIITDIRLDEDYEIFVEYSIIDDIMPTNLEEFEQKLTRFMMSLAQE